MRGRHHPDPVVAGVGDHQVARRRPPPRPPGTLSSARWPGRRPRRTPRCRCRRRCRCPRRSSPARRRCRSLAATTRTRLLPVSAISRLPAASTATPVRVAEFGRWWPGRRRRRTRWCRCRPRCRCPRRSSPARRRCRCVAATTRIRLLPVSAISRLPAASTATPVGLLSSARGGRAAVAGEPAGAVAGDGVDVPGGHRLPVERAGAWPPPPGSGCCRCRRSAGCPARPPPRPPGC